VNVVYVIPLAFVTGTNFNNPLAMFAALIYCPAVTFDPFNCTFPAPGNVVILTPLNVFAGLSFASPNQKFAAVNVCPVFSAVITVAFVPLGSSFTLFTVRTKFLPVLKLPSVTDTFIVVVPYKFATGVTVIVHVGAVPDSVMFANGSNVVFVLVCDTLAVHVRILSTSPIVYTTPVLASSFIVLSVITFIVGASFTQF
jgi:hypothetical protein